MIRDYVLEEVKPEQRQRREHCALVRNRVGQYHIESRNAVGNHDQQFVFDRINVSDFPASEKLDAC